MRLDLLEPSPTASYWHVRARGELHDDLAWTYANPQHDAEPVRDPIAFFDERVDLDIDRAREERPRTQWSR